MKKINLLDNETFTIKGVYGETYVFDGDTLFVDSSNVVKKAVVIKSLRTERGAQDWLKTAGRAYPGAQIFDTESLKSFDGNVISLKSIGGDDDEDVKFDETLPFHVVSTEGGDDDDDEMEALEKEPGMDEEHEELLEDEEQEQDMTETQIAQVLHDAQKLYEMISDEEHLEPWMQAKLVKVAEYMNAIAENLEHEDGDIPEKDDVDGVDKEPASLPPLPSMSEAMEMMDKNSDESMPTLPDMPEEDEKKSVPVDTAMLSSNEGYNGTAEKSVAGQVFKSLHAARQWNRFENPDKDRYYIDIMREKDTRKGFSKSTGLNAKYVVRDRYEDDDTVIKGAYGNKKVPKKATAVPPMKKIDPETLRVAAIKE